MKNYVLIPMIIIEVIMCIALMLLGLDNFPDVQLGKNAWVAFAGAVGWGLYALSNLHKLIDKNDS